MNIASHFVSLGLDDFICAMGGDSRVGKEQTFLYYIFSKSPLVLPLNKTGIWNKYLNTNVCIKINKEGKTGTKILETISTRHAISTGSVLCKGCVSEQKKQRRQGQ